MGLGCSQGFRGLGIYAPGLIPKSLGHCPEVGHSRAHPLRDL